MSQISYIESQRINIFRTFHWLFIFCVFRFSVQITQSKFSFVQAFDYFVNTWRILPQSELQFVTKSLNKIRTDNVTKQNRGVEGCWKWTLSIKGLNELTMSRFNSKSGNLIIKDGFLCSLLYSRSTAKARCASSVVHSFLAGKFWDKGFFFFFAVFLGAS